MSFSAGTSFEGTGCGWVADRCGSIEPVYFASAVAREQMAVDLQGEGWAVMPELHGDIQQLRSVLQEQARIGVPQGPSA